MTQPLYITTSWDDGHPLDLRLANLLIKHRLPATFYIPLGNHRPVLSRPQIHALSAHFEIGAHTVTHCDLLTAPDHVTREEISACKSKLEQVSGRACTAFCFPKGHFRHEHVRHVRDAGYRSARTVELMSLDSPRMQNGVAMIPTTVQAGPAGFSRIARNSLKRRRPGNLIRHLRHSRETWVGTAEAILEYALGRGGVFHFWGHSWEIDEMDEWDNVEKVFALLAQCRGRAVFTDNSGVAKSAIP
jgi:peptidoglycan/xylan/chitin deacetylase (PgdA/CDA1 family)